MKANEILKHDFLEEKKNGKFNIIILGNKDDENKNFISETFPILENKYRHKYLNRFDLCLKEEIVFPKDFLNIYFPIINDKLLNIDILILTYDRTNKDSFEYLKRFYYLYYNKLEENDKPKNIIIMEFNCNPSKIYNEEITIAPDNIDRKSAESLKNLFNGYSYCTNESEEKLNGILKECVNNLKKIYNLEEDYSSFKYIDLDKEINSLILIYGDMQIQQIFISLLLESNPNYKYKKIKDNIYDINYERAIDDKNYKFKLTFKLMNYEYKNSNCNIFLYNMNNNNTFDEISKFIKENMLTNVKTKKIFNIFSLNSNSNLILDNEYNNEIKKGKNLSDEIGANFSIININNNINLKNEIKTNFDKILDQIIECVNIAKLKKGEEKENENLFDKVTEEFKFVEFANYDRPSLYIKEINNKIKTILKDNNNCLTHICPTCYEQLNIKFDDISNLVIIYCNKCNYDPKGYFIDEYIENNKKQNQHIYCQKCHKIFNYNYKTKDLSCFCEFEIINKAHFRKNKKNKIPDDDKEPFIPCFLKDAYCNIHNKFHKYYLKYSKKDLCEDCKEEKKDNNFIEYYNEEKINNLINQKKLEFQKELNFIISLQNKFNECLNALSTKFNFLIQNKIKMHNLKSELIKALQIIKNNNTLISNVNSIKFDVGENFIYKEDDSIENKLKYLYNYLNEKSEINQFFFEKIKKKDTLNTIHNGPYNNLITNDEKTIVTDICGVKDNKLILISFNDGKAKIYDLNINEKKNYPKCIIKEFLPNEGVNSLFVSKNEKTIWKINNSNTNEIIYLNGFEEIKLIQMNNNYDSYSLLYAIKTEHNNILSSIELDYNNILFSNESNVLNIVSLNIEENNEITYGIKEITDLLIPFDKNLNSISKLSDNIISLDLSDSIDFSSLLRKTRNEVTISEEPKNAKNALKKGGYINIDNIDYDVSVGRETLGKHNENVKYSKVLYIDTNNNKTNYITPDNDNDKNIIIQKIKKEFLFDKCYSLLGCISAQENLLLINYLGDNNNSQNELFIFDFNICQFIYMFKFHHKWTTPKLSAKINYRNSIDKVEFIICDDDLNLTQYYYDKNYENKIYYNYTSKADKKDNQKADKLICLYKRILLFCQNNSYYLSNK